MLKGFLLYYILSMLTGNPLLALAILVVLYIIMDKAYLGFLPDFSAPFRRNSRIRSLKAELEVNPANAGSAQELGIIFFEKKDYRKALTYLERANEKVHNSARLYMYKGMALVELNRPDEGKADLERSLELDPRVGHGLPYIYLLRYQLKRGEDPASTAVLEEGLENFASTENFFRMGVVYKKQGKKQRARQMFENALDEYSYVPKRLRRLHRRWALLSRFNLLTTG